METVTLSKLDSQDLSEKTKLDYYDKIHRLERLSAHNLEWIMINPTAMLDILKAKTSDAPASLAAYITPICKLFKLHPKFLEAHRDCYDLYKGYLKLYNKKRKAMYKKNLLTDTQEKNIVTFDEIKNKFCELQKDEKTFTDIKQHLQYVLFAMLLNIKPKRADLGEVYIATKGMLPKSVVDGNYIVLEENNPRLVLNKYKTFKTYGTLSEPLNAELVTVLEKSLKTFPRKYLFVSTNGDTKGKPYTKNSSYSMFVRRAFEQHCGKSMGVSLWRHVYIGENVDFNLSSYEELEDAARLYGHSIGMQLLVYKPMGPNHPVQRRTQEEIKKTVVCKK
jgi:hypothetical protein